MKSIKGTKTEKNLLASFAGESQARNRYTYFSSVAKKEGYEQMSWIFADTADNEKEHAKRFFKFLEGGPVEITASSSIFCPRRRRRRARKGLLSAARATLPVALLTYSVSPGLVTATAPPRTTVLFAVK